VTLTRLWAFLAIALPVLAAVIAPFPSVDLTYHLRAGGDILDTRALPAIDTYTFTVAGRPWVDQQWLAQVAMAAVYRLGSWTGLVVLRAFLVGVAFAFLFDLCRRRAGSIRTAAWLTLTAFVTGAVTLGLRPQLFAVALFAASLWLVSQQRPHGSRVWFLPVLAVVWANVHGTFVLAPAFVALVLVEDIAARRRWAPTLGLLGATALATLVNPFGSGVWAYAVGISTNSVITKRITEWQPTSPLSAEGALFYGTVLLVALAIALAWRRGERQWSAVLWVLPFSILGAWAVRGLAWWPFVAAASVAALAGRASAGAREARPEPVLVHRANASIATGIAVVAVIALPAWRPLDRGLSTPVLVVGTAPSGLTGALRDLVRPGDRILAPQPWGSWLEFAFPQATVAVDSRIELFPDALWIALDRIERGDEGWQQDLAALRPTEVVVPASNEALAARLQEDGWQLQFADSDGRIFLPGPAA